MSNQFDPSISTDATSDDKLWALLCYVIPVIIPVIVLLMDDKKNRPFIKAHAIQALAWEVVYGVISTILSFLFVGVCLGGLCWLLSIYWGVQAYNGKFVTIPVITDFVKKQGWA